MEGQAGERALGRDRVLADVACRQGEPGEGVMQPGHSPLGLTGCGELPDVLSSWADLLVTERIRSYSACLGPLDTHGPLCCYCQGGPQGRHGGKSVPLALLWSWELSTYPL